MSNNKELNQRKTKQEKIINKLGKGNRVTNTMLIRWTSSTHSKWHSYAFEKKT